MRTLVLYTLPPDLLGPDRTVFEFELAGVAEFVTRALPAATVRAVYGRPAEILEDRLGTAPSESTVTRCAMTRSSYNLRYAGWRDLPSCRSLFLAASSR